MKNRFCGENLAENYIRREAFAKWGSLPEVIRSLDSNMDSEHGLHESVNTWKEPAIFFA